MPLDMDAILRQAQEKAMKKATQHKNALVRQKKDRAVKIAEHRAKRSDATRKVKNRRLKDAAELMLQECAPIILRHLDTARCLGCFAPIPDLYFAENIPEGEKRPEKCDIIIDPESNEMCGHSHALSLKRQGQALSRGLDNIRLLLRCSKTDHGAFSATIYGSEGPDKGRNFPAASLRTLSEKNGWQNDRLIKWLINDERTTGEVEVVTTETRDDGKKYKVTTRKTRVLGYNCRSVPEMLEEIIRCRKRIHYLEDELAAARKAPRVCGACSKQMDEAEPGEICIDCNLKGRS